MEKKKKKYYLAKMAGSLTNLDCVLGAGQTKLDF